MNVRFIIHFLWFAASIVCIVALFHWTMRAYAPVAPDDVLAMLEKPWRGPARVALSAVLSVLLLLVQAWTLQRFGA